MLRLNPESRNQIAHDRDRERIAVGGAVDDLDRGDGALLHADRAAERGQDSTNHLPLGRDDLPALARGGALGKPFRPQLDRSQLALTRSLEIACDVPFRDESARAAMEISAGS